MLANYYRVWFNAKQWSVDFVVWMHRPCPISGWVPGLIAVLAKMEWWPSAYDTWRASGINSTSGFLVCFPVVSALCSPEFVIISLSRSELTIPLSSINRPFLRVVDAALAGCYPFTFPALFEKPSSKQKKKICTTSSTSAYLIRAAVVVLASLLSNRITYVKFIILYQRLLTKHYTHRFH